jgi:Leucine-rich repeat (LRR) protein
MRFLKAMHNNDWESLLTEQEKKDEQLEELELATNEIVIIKARIKHMAKNIDNFPFSNALELTHKGYDENEWEDQDFGAFIRPVPSNKKAWKQYESLIKYSVENLSKYRGFTGNWRTDRYNSIQVSKNFVVESAWDSLENLNIEHELIEMDECSCFNNGIFDSDSIENIVNKITEDCSNKKLIATVVQASEQTAGLIIYDQDANEVDKVILRLEEY